ncbi:hypothetical protein NLG97_g9882 [Lecanicillium saksenae]|uniref:Uncharacterized protein n=1 Tax=Lecanicillium saksenae TaxID=468837 RepID=A0ACC1QF10_9HYPO|nr:hypothetical protein NLG97_g9882 [Lecanicillium saksenae]
MQNTRPASAAAATQPSPPRDATVASRDEPRHALHSEQLARFSQGDEHSKSTPRTAGSAVQDGVDSLAAQIGSLGIAATVEDDASPIPPRIVRESGEPAEDVQFCPGSRVVKHASTWYYIAAIPECSGVTVVCTRCYQDYIGPTALADKWTSLVSEDGVSVMCNFHMARLKEILWPQAVAAGSMFEMNAYLKRSVDFQPCPGEKAITGVEGTTWYGLLGGEIQGFSVCETCYEKYVAGTAFDDKFAGYQEKPEEHTWMCHMRGDTTALSSD